jgi:hypothetical protein
MTTHNRTNASLVDRFAEQRARLAGMTFPNALAAGDRAPQFALPNARGRLVDLAELLAAGPVVLTFYRGAWCPYCNTQLRGLQQALPQLESLGAALVAISPQVPDGSLARAGRTRWRPSDWSRDDRVVRRWSRGWGRPRASADGSEAADSQRTGPRFSPSADRQVR